MWQQLAIDYRYTKALRRDCEVQKDDYRLPLLRLLLPPPLAPPLELALPAELVNRLDKRRQIVRRSEQGVPPYCRRLQTGCSERPREEPHLDWVRGC